MPPIEQQPALHLTKGVDAVKLSGKAYLVAQRLIRIIDNFQTYSIRGVVALMQGQEWILALTVSNHN